LLALARKISETRFITLIDAAVPFVHLCAAPGSPAAAEPTAVRRLLIAIHPTRCLTRLLLIFHAGDRSLKGFSKHDNARHGPEVPRRGPGTPRDLPRFQGNLAPGATSGS
jgi:hypothetical protein